MKEPTRNWQIVGKVMTLIAKPALDKPRLNGWPRSLTLAAIILLPAGIPFSILGVPQYVTAQLVQFAIFSGATLRLFQIASCRKAGRFEMVSLLLFIYCTLVSAISSRFFFPLSLLDWLPGALVISPILFILFANALRMSATEVLDGLIIATTFVGLILCLDQVFRFPFLDQFVAYNSRYGSTRRIVLLHNECAFALPLILIRLWNSRNLNRLLYFACALLVGVAALVISESRLVSASILLSIAFYYLYSNRRGTSLILLSAAFVICVALLPIIAEQIVIFLELSNDASFAIRNAEILHFGRFFEQTYGLGFGYMSLSENKNTILSGALYRDPQIYGFADYWFSLVDIRIYAALFQFGWIGLMAVLGMTAVLIASFWKGFYQPARRNAQEMAVLGTTTLAFMASPLPINLFTVENTVVLGGILWFLASKSALLHGQMPE